MSHASPAPLPPHRHRLTDGAVLLRVLLSYLVLILLAQSIAGAMARGAGPLHQHRPAPVHSVAAQVFSHDAAHARAHAQGQRHWHGAADASVVIEPAADEPNLAACALVAATALLALATAPFTPSSDGRHVWHARTAWAAVATTHAPPQRPPRLLSH